MFEKIVVATDFGKASERAVEFALEIAGRFGSQLTLVHSWEAPAYAYGGGLTVPADLVTPIQQAAEAELRRAFEALEWRAPGAACSLRSGLAWEEILAAASELGADLIVLGTHGRRGVSRALLGSVAEKVVRMAHIPVLTVHDSERPAQAHGAGATNAA